MSTEHKEITKEDATVMQFKDFGARASEFTKKVVNAQVQRMLPAAGCTTDEERAAVQEEAMQTVEERYTKNKKTVAWDANKGRMGKMSYTVAEDGRSYITKTQGIHVLDIAEMDAAKNIESGPTRASSSNSTLSLPLGLSVYGTKRHMRALLRNHYGGKISQKQLEYLHFSPEEDKIDEVMVEDNEDTEDNGTKKKKKKKTKTKTKKRNRDTDREDTKPKKKKKKTKLKKTEYTPSTNRPLSWMGAAEEAAEEDARGQRLVAREIGGQTVRVETSQKD